MSSSPLYIGLSVPPRVSDRGMCTKVFMLVGFIESPLYSGRMLTMNVRESVWRSWTVAYTEVNAGRRMHKNGLAVASRSSVFQFHARSRSVSSDRKSMCRLPV